MITNKNMLSNTLFAMSMLIASLALVFAVFSVEVAATSHTTAACQGIDLAGGSCTTGGDETTLRSIITAVVNIISLIGGALSVIFIIVGGLKYITSSGDSSGTKSARDTITYAVVGLLVVLFAQVIVRFVIDRANNPTGPAPVQQDAPPGGVDGG